jgi:leader peptidase (prepilin peptidase)/N-methyltransferase
VADGISIMIAITALIDAGFADIPMMFLTAILITLPQLLITVLKPNCYGGADIKLMASCAFLLGIWKGVFAIIIGLLLAVICTLIIRKVQKKNIKESFALIPYLAVGSMLAFFI